MWFIRWSQQKWQHFLQFIPFLFWRSSPSFFFFLFNRSFYFLFHVYCFCLLKISFTIHYCCVFFESQSERRLRQCSRDRRDYYYMRKRFHLFATIWVCICKKPERDRFLYACVCNSTLRIEVISNCFDYFSFTVFIHFIREHFLSSVFHFGFACTRSSRNKKTKMHCFVRSNKITSSLRSFFFFYFFLFFTIRPSISFFILLFLLRLFFGFRLAT